MSDRQLNYLAIILAVGALFWIFNKSGSESRYDETIEPSISREAAAVEAFNKTKTAQVLANGNTDAFIDKLEENPEFGRQFMDDAEQFLEDATGRSGYFDNHDHEASGRNILTIRSTAEQLGWTKLEPASLSDIDDARRCIPRFRSGFITLENFDYEWQNLRVDWLYIEPESSTVRLAAMAHLPLRGTRDVDFVLFRLNDCQLLQPIGKYPLTVVGYTVPAHSDWLQDHYAAPKFAARFDSRDTTVFDVFVHPEQHTVRTISIRAHLDSPAPDPRLLTTPSMDCIDDLIAKSNAPGTVKNKRFNVVSALPDRRCFSMPTVDVIGYHLSLLEMPLVVQKDETVADMKRRVRRTRPSKDEIMNAMLDNSASGSASQVPGLAQSVDLNRIELVR